jgi:hypothetical protein
MAVRHLAEIPVEDAGQQRDELTLKVNPALSEHEDMSSSISGS